MQCPLVRVLPCTLLLLGCGSSGVGDTDEAPGATTGSEDDTSGSPSTTATTSPATSAEATGEPDPTTGGTAEPTGTGGSTETGDETTGGGYVGPGCPDPLPEAWVLCEDFEVPMATEGYFGTFSTNAGLLSVVDGVGLEDSRALEIGHDPSVFSSGTADIRFGVGPNGNRIHAPDETFREVWVRFFLRTQDGWPDAGIAEAVEVMSLHPASRAIAVDATIYSPSQAEAQAIAWSCIHDSDLLCTGMSDWSNPSLRALDYDLGTSPLYGSEAAGTWQCHEVHVRLDDPGAQNGVFEVSVDNQLEVALDGLELVGSWSDAALNAVRLSSFWNAPAVLDHWVDDIVVSTSPLGCP